MRDIEVGTLGFVEMSGIAIDDTTGNMFLSSTNGSVYLLGFVPAPVAMADLSVAKDDSPDPVTEGDDVTYTITLTNNGPDAATGVLLTDTLPAGATFVSASSGCTEVSGVVTWILEPSPTALTLWLRSLSRPQGRGPLPTQRQ